MKALHRKDLYCWSHFDEDRNIDFNSVLYCHPKGNLLIDPLPLTPHDEAHLSELGGAAWILITNSDHIRDAAKISAATGAQIAAPVAEKDAFPLAVQRWVDDGDEVIPGARVVTLDGSKTPGELALVIDGSTLVTGDLLRSHAATRLHLLPPEKLTDADAARASIRKLLDYPDLETIIVGDGWHLFHGGASALRELVGS